MEEQIHKNVRLRDIWDVTFIAAVTLPVQMFGMVVQKNAAVIMADMHAAKKHLRPISARSARPNMLPGILHVPQ